MSSFSHESIQIKDRDMSFICVSSESHAILVVADQVEAPTPPLSPQTLCPAESPLNSGPSPSESLSSVNPTPV